MYDTVWTVPLARAIVGIVVLNLLVILAWRQFMSRKEEITNEPFDSGLD